MDNYQPLVSIITPSYNQGQFIEETILSVLNQDYGNIEYILIDGGSTDNTLEIIKKYEHKISFWSSEPDKGQTDALSKGFARATGKYITWLCSDDTIEPSAVNIQIAFLIKYNVGLVFGNRTRIDGKGNILGFTKYPEFRRRLLRSGFSLPQETVLFERNLYEKVGGFDPSLKMAMDTDLWIKLSSITPFCHIPTFLGRFRSHNNKSVKFSEQLRTNKWEGDLINELKEVHAKYFKFELSVNKYKQLGKLRAYYSFIDRRSSLHKQKLYFLNSIRQ